MASPRVPARLRGWVRRGSRARWVRKAQVASGYGLRFRARPVTWLRYVVADPELDSFSYDLANEDEIAAIVASAIGEPIDRVRGWFTELHTDSELAAALADRARWRVDARTKPRYGRRVVWYALARAVPPALAVEAGIKDGLGSAVLLRALERNAAEGRPGRLLSFDLSPDRGWRVPPHLRHLWEPVFEPTQTALERALQGRQIGLFVHDSEPTYACEHHEFSVAIDHAADGLLMVSNGDWSTALRDLCEQHGATYRRVRERPAHHFYPGAAIDIGVLRGRDGTAERGEGGG